MTWFRCDNDRCWILDCGRGDGSIGTGSHYHFGSEDGTPYHNGCRTSTPDRELRPQIEAIKTHLQAEGLTDLDEHFTKVFEGYHTISATFGGTRLLRLSYQWLSDITAAHAVAWIRDKEIARSLKADDHELWIRDGGTISGNL